MLTLDANIWIAAYDPRDGFHAESARFLLAVTLRRIGLNGPAILLVETACALARRAQSAAVAVMAVERLRMHPRLALHPMNDHLLAIATEVGTRQLLRGTDALYAATAVILNAPLVSWDEELIRRGGAVTPTDWLAAKS